jgi:hypothetical protein
MDDRYDEMVRRAAELKAESAALKLVSQKLTGRLAEKGQAGPRAMEQPGEQGLAAAAGDSAGEVPATRAWAGILDEDEAVALAGLLEELVARHQPDPLSGSVLQTAALLRRRVAAGRQRSIAPRRGGSAARREAGDARDDVASHRDAQAARRDSLASDRDDRAKDRDRQADAADGEARASDQRMRNRLGDADLRGQEEARTDRTRDDEDREAMREILAQAHAARQAAWHDRYAAGQDRVAANRDRGSAQADRVAAGHDRYVARADRDQAVIENEEEDSPFGD